MTPIAEFPTILKPLFQPKRYKILYGGRGAAKSWSVARALLVLAASRPLRVLCTREVQKSIRDSVRRLLMDQIEILGLPGYTVLDTEIRHDNGSLFIFAGLSEQTVESIKSFEGVDICWCEEAQSISKRSWDVLSPTIRKAGSEIWMTLNPHLETDETYARFVAAPSPDTWAQPVNWRDNPWFTQELNVERRKTRERDPDGYENIWEGVPMRVAEGAIYATEVRVMFKSGRVRNVPHDPVLLVDSTQELLEAMGRRVQVLDRLSVEEGIRAARTVFPRAYVDQTLCARLMECLKRYRRVVHGRTNEPMGPLHDEFSHGADMWRYACQAVERMGQSQEFRPMNIGHRARDWRA